MWTEWLGRTLGARSAEDYERRRARRHADAVELVEGVTVDTLVSPHLTPTLSAPRGGEGAMLATGITSQ
jgi:hypothetical protein